MKVLRVCFLLIAACVLTAPLLAVRGQDQNGNASQSNAVQKRPSRPPGRPAPPRPAPARPVPPPMRPGPPYNFRPGDRDRMRRYYRRNLGYVNRSRRPHFIVGGYVPPGYRGYFRPVPPHLLGYLPPPPPGYMMGYFDGYCVVYHPTTFAIVGYVDLLN